MDHRKTSLDDECSKELIVTLSNCLRQTGIVNFFGSTKSSEKSEKNLLTRKSSQDLRLKLKIVNLIFKAKRKA